MVKLVKAVALLAVLVSGEHVHFEEKHDKPRKAHTAVVR
jgi:hypothetical protein